MGSNQKEAEASSLEDLRPLVAYVLGMSDFSQLRADCSMADEGPKVVTFFAEVKVYMMKDGA